jgi:hydroxymethylpyrimidine pyrophosphatase-like HAD family hydrolase
VSFLALATDYDGTLATDGRVETPTIEALERLKAAGGRLLLVTGRELPDLVQTFDRIGLFDAVVAENGALLFFPPTGEERLIAPAPPTALLAALRARGVAPLSVGRSIVATREPNETVVLEVIGELGLAWQVILNKGAVMCLPPGVDKASGLGAALAELKLSALEVVAVGDGENDHAFLRASGCAVAVGNALLALKQVADLVTRGAEGAGVVELIDRWRELPFARAR